MKHKNYIGGEWVEPASGEYFENRNPANHDDLIGMWPGSNHRSMDGRQWPST